MVLESILLFNYHSLESETFKGKEYVHHYYKKFKKSPYYSG